MKTKHLLLSGAALVVVCVAVIMIFGRTCTVIFDDKHFPGIRPEIPENAEMKVVQDAPVVAMDERKTVNGVLSVTFHALRQGKAFVEVTCPGETIAVFQLWVHPGGVITFNEYFGACAGDIVIPIAISLYMLLLLWTLLKRYRESIRNSLYSYKNVLFIGLIIFLSFLLAIQLGSLPRYRGMQHTVSGFLSSAGHFSRVVLPAAFVLSVLMIVSNITLMRKEGRNWRNLLAAMLSVGLCLLTLLPVGMGEFLQRTTLVDVHNERGAALYVERFTEAFIAMLVTYLECLLAGTVLIGIKSARHIPAFDKDYMLILGCQITKEGGVTPLLRSRADRALAFAKMQKDAGGKELIFVPSGGQGPDEVTSEAAAIKDYLLSAGIPADRILTEDKSTNTFENIRNSMALIREHAAEGPKVAFSTTNYHVFRSGLIAMKQGEKLEGIGSPTKRYFWINAFVREFVATLASQRKTHLLVVAALSAVILMMVLMEYYSVVV